MSLDRPHLTTSTQDEYQTPGNYQTGEKTLIDLLNERLTLMLDRLAPIYLLNLAYAQKLVADIPDEQMAAQPVAGQTLNHAAFIIGHRDRPAISVPAA